LSGVAPDKQTLKRLFQCVADEFGEGRQDHHGAAGMVIENDRVLIHGHPFRPQEADLGAAFSASQPLESGDH